MNELEFDVLINKDNPLKNNYKPNDLVILDNNENNFHNYFDPSNKPSISLSIYDYYKELENASIKDGLHIIVDSGFRSNHYQRHVFITVFRSYIIEYFHTMENVSSFDEIISLAFDKTVSRVAFPGCSEHQSGFAFDAGCYRDGIFSDVIDGRDEALWLDENAYKYGFILRYPKGKEDITGFDYEPWHYRFVGKDVSNLLYNSGDWITLEEYHKGLKLIRK